MHAPDCDLTADGYLIPPEEVSVWRDYRLAGQLSLGSVEKREPMKRKEFDALHDRLGWGSDAHRVAMGAIPA